MKCAASLNTNSSGVVVRCLLFRQRCACCGHTANADVNGARNILAAGHAVLACGGMVQSGRPLKLEPTEMIQATA